MRTRVGQANLTVVPALRPLLILLRALFGSERVDTPGGDEHAVAGGDVGEPGAGGRCSGAKPRRANDSRVR